MQRVRTVSIIPPSRSSSMAIVHKDRVLNMELKMIKLVIVTCLSLCVSVIVAEDGETDGARSEERLVYSARVEVS